MSEARKIREHIRQISEAGKHVAHFTGEVTQVSDTDCTVQLGEMELEGVRLFSVDDAGTLLVKPKVGTKVTVADLSGGQLRDMELVKVDSPELIKYDMNGLVVAIDSTIKKIDIHNNSVSLKGLMSSMYDIISKLTVSTPNGPSGTPLPPTIQALEKFKEDFGKLLK